jgi:predicted transcriptional regulator
VLTTPRRTVRTPDTEGVVLQSFTEDGTRSVRNVADILNQSKNTVQNFLKGKSSTSIIARLYTPGTRRETRLYCKCVTDG